jgi:restriction endonuclease
LEYSALGACSLDVEMETGTGKTYVYIKTMFELNKQYGWSKFIVIVPSIAIREGVKKSFETMEEHFMEYYGKNDKQKARCFCCSEQAIRSTKSRLNKKINLTSLHPE